MASASSSGSGVARCPSCGARLPVEAGATVCVCEYCDARVPLREQAPAPVPKPRGSSSSAVISIVLLAIVMLGAIAFVTLAQPGKENVKARPAAAPAPAQPMRAPDPPPDPPDPPDPFASVPTDALIATGAASTALEKATEHPPSTAKPSTPKPPTGPTISVAEATKQLEPRVLACMRETKTHAVLAYMGNKSAGAVSVLPDPRTRVDGLRAKLAGTKLGRCMNEAGATVRTLAAKSSYVRLALENDAAPDPLADLPATADRKVVASTIASLDADVRACARKHGAEGSRDVFYVNIDGPTGKVISARGSYGPKKFRKCAEPMYYGLGFPRVREHQVKHTHHVQL